MNVRDLGRAAYRKGIGLTFPNQDVDIVWQHKRNRRRRREAREEFSFLFNSPTRRGIELFGETALRLGKHPTFRGVRCLRDGP